MEAKAIAKGLRIQPRKARLVINLIRGKSVEEADIILSNLNKEKIGSAKKEYYDDETELDVGYATHKEAVRSLRRK